VADWVSFIWLDIQRKILYTLITKKGFLSFHLAIQKNLDTLSYSQDFIPLLSYALGEWLTV